jgi:N-acetylmuramoyl-L-alanine amidase
VWLKWVILYFIIAVGHTASGNKGCGVVARLDESNCNREIGALVTGKSEVANQYAAKVSNSLANALNLTNRGVKTQSLIVLNKTAIPATSVVGC